jgi:hypothetical protein
MTTTIIQTITNILNEDGIVQFTSSVESYVLTPAENKVLKNIKTGEIITTRICINKKIKLSDYIEIDKPNTSE